MQIHVALQHAVVKVVFKKRRSCAVYIASAERKHIAGVWGAAPSGVQGQSTCSRGQGSSPLS